MDKKRGVIIAILAAVLFGLGGVIFYDYFKLGAAVESPPAIVVAPPDFDFGKITRDKLASADFEIKNTGGNVLNIKGVATSCGCTKAAVDKQALLPGEVARLSVDFDPKYHLDERGEILREVYIESNIPEGETVVRIKAFIE